MINYKIATFNIRKMKLVLLITIVFCLSGKVFSQSGFKERIALAFNEPNLGYHVAEDTSNNEYLVSGVYFDQNIGRWTASVATYDLLGNFNELYPLRNDTVPFLDFCNHSELIDGKYYFLGLGPVTIDIVCFDTEKKEIKICFSVNRDNNNYNLFLRSQSFIYDSEDNSVTITGSTLESNNSPLSVITYKLGGQSEAIYKESLSHKSKFSRNIKSNSKSEYIISAQLSEHVTFNASKDTSYLYFLDTNLNLIKSTIDYPDNPNFRLGKGMLVDNQDNILITGAKQLPANGDPDDLNLQGVVKYDAEGHHVWTTFLSNSINNVAGWGKWHSIIESVEGDGYIIAGSESYQTADEDTIISKAAIAKLSYEGDSLWMHTFSFREGPRLQEVFHDIIATKDGGYLAVGASSHFDVTIEEEELLPWVQTLILKVDKNGILDTTTSSVVLIDEAEIDIEVFPNPTIDRLYIAQDLNKKLNIQIYDMQGRFMDAFRSDNTNHTVVVDVALWETGMYLLKAQDTQGNVYTRKFVIE